MMMAALVAIVAATLVSEDLTAVSVGLAVREGSLPFAPALLACFVGIYLGDIGLWAAGRFGGRRILRWRLVSRLPLAALHRLGRWIDRHPAAAILGSRCLPGTRVPLYIAAGAWGERHWRFFLWMFVAVALWTPLLVIATILVGDGIAAIFETDATWPVPLLAAAVCFALLQLVRLAGSSDGRTRLSIALARLCHWEFWPSWAIYPPVIVWIGWLALRYRSLTLFTAVNPAIESSGFVGESKAAILALLPKQWVMPWAVIEPGTPRHRLQAVESTLMTHGWSFPLVAKPDVGERGADVAWLHSLKDAERYLSRVADRFILQVPHDGPYEAGLFYVRMPGSAKGSIVSITDKRFPVLIGDGQSTVEALILAHPRFRLQADLFLERHASDRARVLAFGERLAIGRIGNHSKGTQFLDGHHLWTPALEVRIDEIARAAGGFYFGRFDVRYQSIDGFMAGEDLAVIELNGVTSEATHIYGGSLVQAWRTLMWQWSLAFAIGAANRARGHQPMPAPQLFRLIATYLTST